MITDFDIFNKGEFMKGDYFLTLEPSEFSIYKKYKNKIGRATRIRKHYNEFDAEFDGVNEFGLPLDGLEYWSPNREDLEAILAVKKFNL